MRLIDADALDKMLMDAQAVSKEKGGNFRCGVIGNVRENIRMMPTIELLKEQQPRLLTFDEVKDHYSVPVSKLQIERYNDYAEDIKPLYFEFPDPDGWVLHWRGYDKVSTYLREWKKDYGRTWRCWTDKPTDEQSKAEPWKECEQE